MSVRRFGITPHSAVARGAGNPWGMWIEGQFWPFGSASVLGVKIPVSVEGVSAIRALSERLANLVSLPPNRHRINRPFYEPDDAGPFLDSSDIKPFPPSGRL